MRRGNRGKWKVILLAGNQSLRALTLFRRYESMSLRRGATRRAGLPGPWETEGLRLDQAEPIAVPRARLLHRSLRSNRGFRHN
jgi:hypothetical protein